MLCPILGTSSPVAHQMAAIPLAINPFLAAAMPTLPTSAAAIETPAAIPCPQAAAVSTPNQESYYFWPGSAAARLNLVQF